VRMKRKNAVEFSSWTKRATSLGSYETHCNCVSSLDRVSHRSLTQDSCNRCRGRKTKCAGEPPFSCAACEDSKQICVYPEAEERVSVPKRYRSCLIEAGNSLTAKVILRAFRLTQLRPSVRLFTVTKIKIDPNSGKSQIEQRCLAIFP